VPDLSYGWQLTYAYVSYGALAMAYSLVNIPYGSLAAAITQSPQDRAKLATARTMGAAATIMMLAFVVAPQIENSENLQRSLTTITLAFVVIGFACYLFTFRTTRETVERDVTRVGLKESLRAIKSNKPLIMLCLSSVCCLTGMFSLQTINIYYARDVLGNASYFIVLTVLSIGGMFVIAPFVPKVVATLGKKRGYIVGGAIAMAGALGLMFAPASMPMFAFISFGVMGLGLGAVNTLMWALEADTVEYGEWRTGMRIEGANYAVFSFVRKVGQAIGGAAAAYTIGFAGYIAGETAQSEQALWGIRAAAGIVPMSFIGAGIAIMTLYPLTESTFARMVGEVAERRAARQTTQST
jgi:glucuronide carrier protein